MLIQTTLRKTQQLYRRVWSNGVLYRIEQRMSVSGQYEVWRGSVSGAGVDLGVIGVHHPGGGRGDLQQAGHAGGLARPLLPADQELEGEGGDDDPQDGSEDDVLRVVFVVGHSGEGGEDCEQSAAHLDERLHQTEVPGVHPLLEEDHAEPHAVGGEAGVARHEAEPHVWKYVGQFRSDEIPACVTMESLRPLARADVLLTQAVELSQVVGTVQLPTQTLAQSYVGRADSQEVGP